MKTPDPHALATALESAAARLRESDQTDWTPIIQTLIQTLLPLLIQWIQTLLPQPAPQSHVDVEDAPELD